MKTLPNTTTRAQKLAMESPTSPTRSISTMGSKGDGAVHCPFDPVNDPPSTHEIIHVVDRRIATNEVIDSDGLSLRTIMSVEDQSDLTCTSNQPQQSTTQGSFQPQLHPPDNAFEEEVISTWLNNPPRKRHEVLSKAFSRQGHLRKEWKYLRPRIEVAKEEEKRQAAVNKQKRQPLLEAPVGVPKGFNFPPELQSAHAQEAAKQLPAEEPLLLFQGEDAGVVLDAQLSGPNERIDSTMDDHRPGSPLSLPSQPKDRAPTGGNFSTQNTKSLSNLKTYGKGHNQSFKASTRKEQRRAENGSPGRILRPGLPAKPSDTFKSLPAVNITPHQANAQQLSSISPAELPPQSGTPPCSPLKEIERSLPPDTIRVDSFQAPTQKSQTLISQTDLVLASPSDREQETATRVLHGRIQQQLSRNSKPCKVCQQKGCSCKGTAHHLEEILCNNIGCIKKWWGADDLWDYCGIKLSDAQEGWRRFNCWFCPQCLNKARVLLQHELLDSAYLSISRSPAMLIQVGSGHSGRLDNGLWPEDGELRDPLQHLVGMLQQYTGNTTMARNKLSPINPQTQVLDIPCIRDETRDQSAGSANHAVRVIRKLLDVPNGVLIKDKIREGKLQNMTCPVWIRGVLSFLISDFVFNRDSPFEDAALWKKTLVDAGHSLNQAENLIHDHRIRLMKAFEKRPDDPEIPPEFLDRVTRRLQGFIEQLNATMLPLVGGDSDVEVRHRALGKVALELNLKAFAYRGTFEEIKPQMLDSFNPECHTEENPGSDCSDFAGKPILMTTMVGVRFKHPEKGWRTCSHAKVKMWPENNKEDQPKRVPLPDMAGGGPSQETNRRILPKKRQIGEVA